MNILLIAPQPFHEKRGTPLAVALLARALGELGHQIDLITYHLGSDYPIPGVRHRRAARIPFITSIGKGLSAKKLFLDIFVFIKAVELVWRNRYDCIHGVEEGVFMGILLKWTTGVPVVYDMDSSIPEQMGDSSSSLWSSTPCTRLAAMLENWAVKNANLVLAVCSALQERVSRICPQTPVAVLEDIPVSEKAAADTPKVVQRLMNELGIDGRPCIVYTGTFEAYQGIELLLQSIPQIVQTHPTAVFVLVGGQPDQLPEVTQLCEKMGIMAHLRIVGRRPLEEMPAFMAMATILVSPRTLGSNTPMKIYSYMQSGRAIVATRLPTHTQVLDDSRALLAEADAASFAAAVAALLDNPEQRRRLGAAAAAYVDTHFTYDVFKQKLKDAYARLKIC